MEDLNSALAELMQSLGVRSNEFIDWLTGTGFESYVRLQLARNACLAAFTFAIIVVCSIALRWAYDQYMECNNISKSIDYECVMLVSAIILGMSVILFIMTATSTIEWLVAPEGLIVERLLGIAGR